jgi:hypothetical protein
LIYNALVLDADVLSRVHKNAMVMDLASPLGGIDHEAGRALGLQVIWARAQGADSFRLRTIFEYYKHS